MASVALAFDILAKDRASKTLKNVGDSASKAGDHVGRLGSRFAGLGKAAALGVGAAAVGAIALGKSFVDAAIESQKVTKQTEAVLKSMGGVAGVTADQVSKLSTKLSLQSGIDDELIQSGQNVLLTFGKVQNKVGKGNKIFDRATEAALNMSVALGTDMQGATIQVGKALNDPIKGITALSRAGVSFTQKQKDTIKSLVEQGKTLDAQKIILGELEKQFGGSAEAQATAGDRLKVVWGNLQEQLGNRLLPIIEKVADWLGKTLPPVLDALGGYLQPVLDQIGAFWSALTTGKTEDEGTPIENVALAIRDAFDAVVKWWEDNGDTIKTTIGDALGHFADVLTTVGRALRDDVVPKFKEWGDWLLKDGPGVEIAITGIATALGLYAASAVAAGFATIIAIAPYALLAIAIGGLAWATGLLWEKWKLGPKVSMAFMWIKDHVLEPFVGAVEAVIRAVQAMLDLLDKIPDWAKPNLGGSGSGDGAIPNWVPFVGPFLDDGGVMPGVRGVHYPAMVAGGETVIPTHKPGVSLGGSGPLIGSLTVIQQPGEDAVGAAWRVAKHHRRAAVGLAT